MSGINFIKQKADANAGPSHFLRIKLTSLRKNHSGSWDTLNRERFDIDGYVDFFLVVDFPFRPIADNHLAVQLRKLGPESNVENVHVVVVGVSDQARDHQYGLEVIRNHTHHHRTSRDRITKRSQTVDLPLRHPLHTALQIREELCVPDVKSHHHLLSSASHLILTTTASILTSLQSLTKIITFARYLRTSFWLQLLNISVN